MPSAILVRIENRGSFAAAGADVAVTVDGQAVGTDQVKPLAPGENQTIAMLWNPTHAGSTNVVATIDYADDVSTDKFGSANVTVRAQQSVLGTYLGVIGGTCGAFALNDDQGNTIAQLLLQPGTPVTTLSYNYAQKTAVTGYFSIGPQGPQIAVRSVSTVGRRSASTFVRNPCATPAPASSPQLDLPHLYQRLPVPIAAPD